MSNLALLSSELPVDTPLVFGHGIISTDDFEFAITFNPEMDEMFFTRRKPGETNKIYTTQLVNNKWTEPELAFFSKDYFDFEPHISPEGNKLYFGSLRPIDNGRGLHQWFSARSNGSWSEPQVINASFAKEKMMMYLTSSMDETIYFTIIRDGLNSGIFYSEKNDDKYTLLSRLPENINQADSITVAHPFIAPDESYVIFDLEKKGGFGSCDLYISFRRKDGSWAEAINLGSKINTEWCEMCASVSPDGKYLFFHRGNDSDTGNIYWFDFNQIIKLRENYNLPAEVNSPETRGQKIVRELPSQVCNSENALQIGSRKSATAKMRCKLALASLQQRKCVANWLSQVCDSENASRIASRKFATAKTRRELPLVSLRQRKRVANCLSQVCDSENASRIASRKFATAKTRRELPLVSLQQRKCVANCLSQVCDSENAMQISSRCLSLLYKI